MSQKDIFLVHSSLSLIWTTDIYVLVSFCWQHQLCAGKSFRSLEFVVNSELIMLLTGGWWIKHALLKVLLRRKSRFFFFFSRCFYHKLNTIPLSWQRNWSTAYPAMIYICKGCPKVCKFCPTLPKPQVLEPTTSFKRASLHDVILPSSEAFSPHIFAK